MTALMRANPKTSRRETGGKAVESPQGKLGSRVEGRVRQCQLSRVNVGVEELSGLVNQRNHNCIPGTTKWIQKVKIGRVRRRR